VVVAGQACVAVEAMEGTDATIERAGAILRSLEAGEEASVSVSTLDRRLSVVKVAKPKQDMRFDVPVIGPRTIEVMRLAGATCLSIEAGRTLIFDLDAVQQLAAAGGIAIIAV
jgi:UDP-2,3-diacylglucosamine hydrolase